MGLFSSSKPSGSSSSLESAGIATLGGAQVSLTLLEKMSDGALIPFVKAAAGTAVEVIKIVKAIQTNREDCDELLKRSTSLLVVILGSFNEKPESDIPGHLKQGVDRLNINFHEVLDVLQTIDRRAGKSGATSYGRALLYHYDNAEKLKGCSEKLNWAMQEFQVNRSCIDLSLRYVMAEINSQVTAKVNSCLRDLERHEELRKGQVEIQKGLAEVRDAVMEQVEIQRGIAEAKDAKEQTMTEVVPRLPTTFMPANPRIFGRHEYIENAVELLLSDSNSRLAILGPGGMGKTSVALKVVHDSRVVDRFGKNRHWVACEQATSIPLLVELLAKSLKLPKSTSNDRFDDVLVALESSDMPHLFLFDNFETPWDIEGQQSYLGDILTRISSIPSASLILTMRGNQQPYSDSIDWTHPPLPSLTQLELSPAQEVFLKISPDSANDADLHTLLNQLDCMPLAITLMAKLARAGETVPQLLSLWKTERTKLLGQPGGDRRTSIEVSIKLSLESRSVKANKEAVNLLSILAMLPGGASINRLPDICPSIPNQHTALRVLLGAALIYHNPDKSSVLVLSPIRSYVLLHHYPEPGPLQDLRASYYRLAKKGNDAIGKPDFFANVKELVKEEANMDALLLESLQSTDGDKVAVVQASVDYSEYLRWTQPRINIIDAAEQVARVAGLKQHAQCLESLGGMLRLQGQYEAAKNALEEARSKYMGLGNRCDAADCLGSLGDILQLQNQYDAACTTLEKARSEYNELGNELGAANCLRSLGDILQVQCKYNEAHRVLDEAKSKYASLGNHQGAVNCLRSVGDILRMQGRHDAARSVLEEAKTEYSSMGNRLGVANCFRSLGEILYFQRQYEAARSAIGEAQSIYNTLGLRLGATNCLRTLGEIFQAETQYEAAVGAMEEALVDYRGLGDHMGTAGCLWFLGNISCIQHRYSDALGQFEEAKGLYSTMGLTKWADNCAKKLDGVRQASDGPNDDHNL